MMGLDLRSIARALVGEVVGAQVLAPGPNHSRRDRSLSVALSASSPDGFLAHSHCGDDWRDCRDHVRERLGLDPKAWKATSRDSRPQLRPQTIAKPDDNVERTAAALRLWSEGVDPAGTPVETYLSSRRLELAVDGEVLRWHSRLRAMLALFRNIATDSPQAVSRTYLDHEARKIERRFLGPVGGAAIKLDADEDVLGWLHIGEGVETILVARMLGLKPTWALGSAGAIAAFPVLSGIECLSLLREHDDANKRAAIACGTRWKAAGREVFNVWPKNGKDVNDTIREGAA
jgi:Toprim domain-containing protein